MRCRWLILAGFALCAAILAVALSSPAEAARYRRYKVFKPQTQFVRMTYVAPPRFWVPLFLGVGY